MVSKKEEKEIFEQNLKEAVEESKQPDPNPKTRGYVGIGLGILAFFLPYPLAVFSGIITAVFGMYAAKHGEETLGKICGVLAILTLFSFFLSIRF